MTAGSPKPQRDDSMADGASEAEAAREVAFETNEAAGPDAGRKDGDEKPDVEDGTGAKGAPGKDDGPPAPDAIALEELTAENDDGAG